MNHAQRRLAEIRAAKAKPKKIYVRRNPTITQQRRAIPISRTDADTLRFIARKLREDGMPNFAAKLEEIAATGEACRECHHERDGK